MGNWKFFLAESDDMEITADITNNARNKQLALNFNRSGNCTFQLPLTTDFLNYTQTNQKCVICMKNDQVVWSGPIWTRSIDLDAERIDVSSVGWFEILMSRFLWDKPSVPSVYVPDFSSGQTDMTIGIALLKIANADFPTYISYGTSTGTGQTRQIKYEVWQSIGEEIINLSEAESGFDIYMDPVTREMNFKAPTNYTHRTSIPFGMNHGVNNISNIVIEENGGELRNRIQVVGKNNLVYYYPPTEPTASQTANNLMTEVIQATETDDALMLQAIANSQAAIKENGMINYDITLKPQGSGNQYELFEDYFLGDRIDVIAQKQLGDETIVFQYEPRIFGATINIDEQGVERVSSLQTTYSGS